MQLNIGYDTEVKIHLKLQKYYKALVSRHDRSAHHI